MPVQKKNKIIENIQPETVAPEAINQVAAMETDVKKSKKQLKSKIVSAVEPVAESVAESVAELAVESVAESVAESVVEPENNLTISKSVKKAKIPSGIVKEKTAKKVKAVITDVNANTEVVNSADEDIKARSFKVQLPNDTEFTGRFTGLTPYQAANKALSKYFRNQENANLDEDNKVEFSIKESSRGSKRQIYSYKGSRIKLETAITYTIKSLNGEERIITKQYKNQLIKVKKNTIDKVVPVYALA